MTDVLPAELVTGNAVVDAHHRLILEKVAELALSRNVEYALPQLEAYFNEHFAVEEEIMRDVNYPGYWTHYSAHREFYDRWRNIRALYLTRHDDEAKTMLIASLESWLREHVLNTDKRLAEYLRTKGET